MKAKTVLLIEEGSMVRRFVHACVEIDGYRVLGAENSQVALSLWHQFSAGIALVIVDHSLKEPTTGSQVAVLMRESRADLPVLQISGHSCGFVEDQGGILPQSGFLEKPFGTDQLRAKVLSLLHGFDESLASNASAARQLLYSHNMSKLMQLRGLGL